MLSMMADYTIGPTENQFCQISLELPELGFEPTLPKKTELKSAALDHSAIQVPHDVTRSEWILRVDEI